MYTRPLYVHTCNHELLILNGMNKSTFKKQYLDVCMQDITFDNVLSRKVIEDKVIQLINWLNIRLLRCESSRCKLKVFTSYQFGAKLKTMTKETQILDENTGLVGTIVSGQPFIFSCEMSVRVDFGNGTEVYACTYFN